MEKEPNDKNKISPDRSADKVYLFGIKKKKNFYSSKICLLNGSDPFLPLKKVNKP